MNCMFQTIGRPKDKKLKSEMTECPPLFTKNFFQDTKFKFMGHYLTIQRLLPQFLFIVSTWPQQVDSKNPGTHLHRPALHRPASFLAHSDPTPAPDRTRSRLPFATSPACLLQCNMKKNAVLGLYQLQPAVYAAPIGSFQVY
jgi:hypothetical protein